MELTIDNLYAFLKSTNIKEEELESLNSEFNRIIKSLLDEFFPNWKALNITRTSPITQGGRCYIDSRCEEKIFNNITVLNFYNLYPNIIIKLSEECEEIMDHSESDPFGEESWDVKTDGLYWNVPEFFKLYKFIFESREELKAFGDSIINELVKILINHTYGSLASRYSTFYAFGAENISALGRNIMDIFINGYPNNVIYTDTDQVFFLNFDEIKEKVEKDLEKIGFEYDFRKINTLVLLKKKKYIESEDYNLKTKGMKKILKLQDRQSPIPRKYSWPSRYLSKEQLEKQIKELDTNFGLLSGYTSENLSKKLKDVDFDDLDFNFDLEIESLKSEPRLKSKKTDNLDLNFEDI